MVRCRCRAKCGANFDRDGVGPSLAVNASWALTWSALQVLASPLGGDLTMTRTFSIAHAASQTGMSIDALRYYERSGLIDARPG